MWTIMVGESGSDDPELREVMVANSANCAWGTFLHESDPLYATLLEASDAVIKRCQEGS